MTFLAPLMLIGGAAVSIPLAVHFFFKARYKPLPWGPMKFLREAIEQTSRRIKFQEWILLALRCLVVLLLALALARPGVTTAGASGRGEAIDAVLVIDNSYSMGAQDGDRTRLERARDAALQVIDGLPANSSVQVFTCSDRATLLGPPSRSNLDQARELVKGVRTCGLATDFLPGLTEALKAAEAGSAPVKEVYLFSDLQKLGFEPKPTDLRAKCEEIKGKANLVFVRCGALGRKVPNLAVTDVRPVGLIPHTNTRIPFEVTLRNTGDEPVKGVKLGLELDGVAVTGEVVQVDEVPPRTDQFKVTLTGETGARGGPRLLTARLSGDGLPGDDRFDRLILVQDRVRVLIVDGDLAWDDPRRFGADYVETGLTGQPSARFRVSEPRSSNPAPQFLRITTRRAREVSPADLAGMDLVFLCNVPVPEPGRPGSGVSQDFVNRLAEFVGNGGGLVIGCGEHAKALDPGGGPAYNRVLGSGGAGLLPFDLASGVTGVTDVVPASSPLNPVADSIDEKEPFLNFFRENTDARAILQDVRVYQSVRLTFPPPDSPEAAGRAVVVRLSDQKPFLASREVGDGRVLLLTTTLDEREKWNDFAGIHSRVFVPFCQLVLADLIERRVAGRNKRQTAGQPIVWYPKAAAGSFELVLPVRANETSARRVRLGPAQAPNPGDRLSVSVPATETGDAGVYRIVPEGKAPGPDDPTFALNPDLTESRNLDVATDAELAERLGFAPTVIPAGASVEAAVTQARARREWTEWLLLGLLVLLLGESVWAWVCGRAW